MVSKYEQNEILSSLVETMDASDGEGRMVPNVGCGQAEGAFTNGCFCEG